MEFYLLIVSCLHKYPCSFHQLFETHAKFEIQATPSVTLEVSMFQLSWCVEGFEGWQRLLIFIQFLDWVADLLSGFDVRTKHHTYPRILLRSELSYFLSILRNPLWPLLAFCLLLSCQDCYVLKLTLESRNYYLFCLASHNFRKVKIYRTH